ncbi:CynX/NimT family MFS transporter [Thalassospira xianhensis]|uniref:Cyanate permease n=2 Tax=Thalassospira TaxID=168934 RepID=A0A285RPC7_9PROT|nr:MULTISPECIES: MFS transporter [Thalassospira]RCK03973.1 MFS transporter [Thalassospira xianhensis MCCC 1A02616]SOB95910.1 Cyanate permease [Thalassospira xiamenensis]
MPPIFAICVLYGLGLTASMQVGLVGPIAPDLRAGFDLSQAQFGLVASLITAAGAIFAIPAGVWAAQAGLRRSLFLGGIMMIIGAALFATASSTGMLYVGRLVTSVGYLLIVVGAPSWMTNLGNARTVAMAMSIWGTFIPVGIAMGNWTSAAIVAWLDWRMAVVACTIPVAVLLPALMLLSKPREQSFNRSLTSGISGVLKSRPAMQIALTFAAFAGATSASLAFMPAMMADNLAISIPLAAAIIGITAIAGNIIGSVGAGMALGRDMPGRIMLAIGLPVMAAAIFTLFVSQIITISVLALVLFNIGQGVVAGTCFALLPRIADRNLSMPALQGMLAQFAEISVVIVPPVAGAMIDWANWKGAAFLLAGFYLAGFAISLRYRQIRVVTAG